jgi:hypothetical protein
VQSSEVNRMRRVWSLVAVVLVVGLLVPEVKAGTGAVVAVFDIEDTREGKAKLSAKKLRSLTDYLANKLGVGGKFEIVPRASVRKAIAAKKKESHKECYDESCQIEIGKEIAAQKSLATKIDQMGGECIVTATLYDLRKGATENSASYRGPCGHSELLTAIEQIAFKLRGEKPSRASKKGIRFDTTALPEVPTLSMPSDADGASAGVDFGNVDVDSMELLDAAIQADKDKNLPIKEKISRWQAVKKKAPKYRKQATAKIVAWKQYQRKKLEIEKIQKKRVAKMMKDWKKLSRLLKLRMVSDEDKNAWRKAFYESYGEEVETNPFVKKSEIITFFKEGASVMAGLTWLKSIPAGIEFTKSEVTVAQYRACVEAGKCSKPKTKAEKKSCNWGHSDRDKHPINCVDWKQAKTFCEWTGGRLPTEQNWGAEASNGGKREYPWGDEKSSCDRAAIHIGKSGCGRGSTWPVCSKERGDSVSGLCNMGGNVAEWTSSRHGSRKDSFVARGGSYRTASFTKLALHRYYYSQLRDFIGFRCARSASK